MWSGYIKRLEEEYIGQEVDFEGKQYKIVKVDINGILHINRPTGHNETTAAFMPHEVKGGRR